MAIRLLREGSGSAAAEMAMVTPLLLVLLFGSFELGFYFFGNHVVAKAVRDGARFASRQGFSQYSCPSTVSNGVIIDTRNVTRTNQVGSGGTPRLGYWSDPNTVTVSVRCDTSGTYSGFYEGMAGVPVVSVSATVPYASLFEALGFNATTLNITARSEVPVMGL